MMTCSFKFDGNFPYELKQDTRCFSDFFQKKTLSCGLLLYKIHKKYIKHRHSQ